ncbi:MAG: D-alanyl-D-alanine carboxypeptidase [Ferruginibacter sp.]
MKLQHFLFIIPCSIFLLSSCSVSKQISKQANTILLNDTAISTGHIGISIYEPATNTYWYNYNATKNFIPASNTKLFTLYAGMKYLGDSLVGARFYHYGTSLFINPAGDPTFLHPDYDYQPLLKLLTGSKGDIYINAVANKVNKYGKGWAHDDYNESYMTERSRFPIYGNMLWVSSKPIYPKVLLRDTIIDTVKNFGSEWVWIKPKYFAEYVHSTANNLTNIKLSRDILVNTFLIEQDFNKSNSVENITIPFAVNEGRTSIKILKSILNKKVINGIGIDLKTKDTILHSQPTDSLFKPMMHRSDNFFAEQTLLMASNEHLGYMSDEKIIDTILKTDLKDIPQKPRWVDGSGLSRYNLFTPQSFVYLLNKMKNEFGWERVKNILPTGGTGTLLYYYKKDSSFIYAKTGTLSNNCALSGYLITKKGKFLIFSVLANNYQSGATPVRRAVEKFLQGIRENY